MDNIRKFLILLFAFLLIISKPVDASPASEIKDVITVQPCLVPKTLRSISLPKIHHNGFSLEESIANRRTTRIFSDMPLTLKQLAQILWAAQGITNRKTGQRAAPSAGRTYPIDLYISPNKVEGISCGLYIYRPENHQLILHREGYYRDALYIAALEQQWVKNAAVVIIFVADPSKVAAKYGDESAEKSVYLEAGHISENIYLQATSMGLAVGAIGGFSQDIVDRVLSLDEKYKTVYINILGNKNK